MRGDVSNDSRVKFGQLNDFHKFANASRSKEAGAEVSETLMVVGTVEVQETLFRK